MISLYVFEYTRLYMLYVYMYVYLRIFVQLWFCGKDTYIFRKLRFCISALINYYSFDNEINTYTKLQIRQLKKILVREMLD